MMQRRLSVAGADHAGLTSASIVENRARMFHSDSGPPLKDPRSQIHGLASRSLAVFPVSALTLMMFVVLDGKSIFDFSNELWIRTIQAFLLGLAAGVVNALISETNTGYKRRWRATLAGMLGVVLLNAVAVEVVIEATWDEDGVNRRWSNEEHWSNSIIYLVLVFFADLAFIRVELARGTMARKANRRWQEIYKSAVKSFENQRFARMTDQQKKVVLEDEKKNRSAKDKIMHALKHPLQAVKEGGIFQYPYQVVTAIVTTIVVLFWCFAKTKRFVKSRSKRLKWIRRDINIVRAGSSELLNIYRAVQSSGLCTQEARQANVINIGREAIVDICRSYLQVDQQVLDVAVYDVGSYADSFEDASEAVRLGGDIAVFTAFFFAILAIIPNLAAYKDWFYAALKGSKRPGINVTTSRNEFELGHAAEYYAAFISVHLGCFYMMFFAFAIIISLFLWDPFWDYLAEYITTNEVIVLAIAYIINVVVLRMLIANAHLSSNGFIKRPWGWRLYSSVLIIYFAINGILGALFRVLCFIPIFAMSLTRLDITLYPTWAVEMDTLFRSFHTIVAFHTRNTSPVHLAAVALFSKSTRNDRPKERTRAMNRWAVASMIAANPALAKYRKISSSIDYSVLKNLKAQESVEC